MAARGVAFALGAAALFGVGAAFAKILLAVSDPWMLAGLLYVGSGAGLAIFDLVGRRIGRRRDEAPLRGADAPWVIAAIVSGGVAGPVLLMLGLSQGSASATSLLLNLESVFTALLAWFVFREHFSGRIVIGMVAIVAGAFAIGWNGTGVVALDRAAVLVAGACLAWAADNNFTRRVSAGDPVQFGALKGLAAGTLNVLIAHAHGAPLPRTTIIAAAAALGVVSYGVSFVLYMLALRELGTGRTSAYFSTAPFIGALGGVVVLDEPISVPLIIAAVLMAAGVWLHVTERHEHEHVHESFEHEHLHTHDDHHRHDHPPGALVTDPHSHRHVHAGLRHAHPHFPDIHHRHSH